MMRALKKAFLGSLLLLTASSGVVAIGCGGDARGQSNPSPTAAEQRATRVSPSPTVESLLDATTRFGSVHSVALPVIDGNESWLVERLVPGAHTFLVYDPPEYVEGCSPQGCPQFPPGDPEKPGRLGLWNVDTGVVDEISVFGPGDQLPASASDGRFLAWAEGCPTGVGGGWRLYAMDLTTRESWRVDTDFATVSGDSALDVCPPVLAVDDGHAVYSTAIANLGGGYVYELRSYDLATRARSILGLSGDAPTADVGCSACGTSQDGLLTGYMHELYVEDGRLIWVGSGSDIWSSKNTRTTPDALYATDLSNGNTSTLFSNGDLLGAAKILLFLTGTSGGFGPAGGWLDPIESQGAFVTWVERPENVAMAYDRNSGDLIKLSDCSVNSLAADDQAIYWTCGDQLHWVDLSH